MRHGARRGSAGFEDTDLALCAVEGLVDQGLIETSIVIPDLDDEAGPDPELGADRLATRQTPAIDALLALLDERRAVLPQLKRITGALQLIADFYEPRVASLAGIEACVGLEAIAIWSDDPALDLSPLRALPRLARVDLTCARVADLSPLVTIRSLAVVVGVVDGIDAQVAKALRRRNVALRAAG